MQPDVKKLSVELMAGPFDGAIVEVPTLPGGGFAKRFVVDDTDVYRVDGNRAYHEGHVTKTAPLQ